VEANLETNAHHRIPYSIQTLKRLRPALFRQDLIALFDLLQQQKIRPLIAQRFPLAEARRAQELLGNGGVVGKIVLVRNGSSLESGGARQRMQWMALRAEVDAERWTPE
jgi:hypothetical protein